MVFPQVVKTVGGAVLDQVRAVHAPLDTAVPEASRNLVRLERSQLFKPRHVPLALQATLVWIQVNHRPPVLQDSTATWATTFATSAVQVLRAKPGPPARIAVRVATMPWLGVQTASNAQVDTTAGRPHTPLLLVPQDTMLQRDQLHATPAPRTSSAPMPLKQRIARMVITVPRDRTTVSLACLVISALRVPRIPNHAQWDLLVLVPQALALLAPQAILVPTLITIPSFSVKLVHFLKPARHIALLVLQDISALAQLPTTPNSVPMASTRWGLLTVAPNAQLEWLAHSRMARAMSSA